MAVHSARSFRTGWIKAAYCSCLLAGGIGWSQGTANAQTPVSPGRTSQVEMWQGNHRLGAEPPAAPALTPVPPPSPSSTLDALGTTLPPVRSDIPWTPPPPVPAAPPLITPVAAVKESTPATQPAQIKELSQQLIRSTSKLATDCQSALDTCAVSLRSSGDRLVETLTVPVKAKLDKAQPTTIVVTPSVTPDSEGSLPWYKVVWLQVIVGGSALVVGPLMVALMLGLILRRSGLQLRVEVVNSGGQPLPLGVAYGVSRIDTTQPDQAAKPIGRIEPDLGSLAGLAAIEAVPFGDKADEEPPFTGEQFDLGPSYDEERVAKQEADLAREQAILQEIFEENLKLQEELRLQEEEAAPPAPVFAAVAAAEVDDLVSEPIGYLTDDPEPAV